MKNKDDLFSLIKKMSPSEKRHFKLHANQQVKGKQNSYVSMFEAFDKQQEYDEKKLLLKLEPKIPQKKFGSIKNYLYHAILKSLNVYNTRDTISFQIQNEIRNIHSLLKKDQLKKAAKHYLKAKQMAWTFEKFELLLELLVIYDKLIPGMVKKKRVFAARVENYQEKNKVLEIIQNRESYRLLLYQVFEYAKSVYVVRSEEDIESIEGILRHPILQNIDHCQSFTAKSYFLRIKAVCFYSLGSYREQLSTCQTHLNLFQEHEAMIGEYLSSYVKTLFNLIYAAIKVQDIATARSFLGLLNEVPDSYGEKMSFFLRSHLFETSALLKMQLYASEANFSSILHMVPEVEANIKTYKLILESDFLAEIWFTIAKAFFQSQKYGDSLKFTSYILNMEKSHLNFSIFCLARLLRLMIYWEQRERELMVSSIRATSRFLQKHDRFFPTEKSILQAFSKLVKSKNRIESARIFLAFQELLSEIMLDPNEMKFLELIDIKAWVVQQYQALQNRAKTSLPKAKTSCINFS